MSPLVGAVSACWHDIAEQAPLGADQVELDWHVVKTSVVEPLKTPPTLNPGLHSNEMTSSKNPDEALPPSEFATSGNEPTQALRVQTVPALVHVPSA